MSAPGYYPHPSPADAYRAHWALAIVWVARSLAICVVLLRLYTRVKAKHTAGWDDACITVSACLTVFGGINDCLRTAHGWGQHIGNLSYAQLAFVQEWMTIAELSNFLSLFFVRLSICIFTLRLLPESQTWPRRFTFGAIALNFLTTLANCMVFSMRCIPMRAIWDMSVHGKCLTLAQLGVAFDGATAGSVVVDFVVIAVPVFVIRNLQMNRRTKIGVCVIMCLSFLTACLSIGKMISIVDLRDPSYDTVPVYLFSIFEEECGIICASMPAMRQLYKVIKEKRSGHSRLHDDHPGYGVAVTPNRALDYSGSSTHLDRKEKSDYDIEMAAIHNLERD